MTDHSHEIDDLNLPIALRRTRRTGTGTVRRTPCVSDVGLGSVITRNPSVACTREVSPPTPPSTPRRNWKNKITKTVTARGNKTHFPTGTVGLQLVEDDELSSTGLTPMVRRTSLQPPSPAPGSSSKCTYKNHNTAATPSRRRSAPSKLASTQQPNTSNNQADLGAEAASTHLLPLRQSHYHKRRTIQIRRKASLSSALSEEKMNRVYTERRKREKEAQEEIDRLRAELKEKNETIERFHQNDDTVELEFDAGMVDAGREDPARTWGLEMERENALRQAAVIQQQTRQPRSPETPTSYPTFHTALSMRQSEDLGGYEGEDRQQQHHDPGSGSDTEALSLTSSQFSEAIRARLHCSTPPPSGSRARHQNRLLPTTTAGAAGAGAGAAGTRLFSTPPTTSPMAMAMAIARGAVMPAVNGPGTELLPITPCSNSRHGGRPGSASSSRRTSEATTIHHNLHNGMNEEELETTPTQQSRRRISSSASASSTTQPQQQNRGGGSPTPEQQLLHDLHSQELATLTTQNTTLQASLSRSQGSLRAALQLVKRLERESDQLRGETLLLQREKRELLEVVREMGSVREVVRERVRQALERRDEMWKGRMKMLGEGIVEGIRGAFEEVIEDVLMDSGVGMDDEMPGVEPEGLSRKRKRGREEEEEEDDADEEEEEEEEEDQAYEGMQREDGNGESCDLGIGNLGAGVSSGNGRFDDGLEDVERRMMRVRERMMRKRRRRTGDFGTEEESDPDA